MFERRHDAVINTVLPTAGQEGGKEVGVGRKIGGGVF